MLAQRKRVKRLEIRWPFFYFSARRDYCIRSEFRFWFLLDISVLRSKLQIVFWVRESIIMQKKENLIKFVKSLPPDASNKVFGGSQLTKNAITLNKFFQFLANFAKNAAMIFFKCHCKHFQSLWALKPTFPTKHSAKKSITKL